MKKQPHRLATEPSLQELFMKLSPAGRRAFFDRLLADDFLAFLKKVFETVSPERSSVKPGWSKLWSIGPKASWVARPKG